VVSLCDSANWLSGKGVFRHGEGARIPQWRCIILAALLLPSISGSFEFGRAHATTADDFDALGLYAVNVFQTPKQPWPGYGIYLGRGLVITAAHVLGHVGLTKPTVLIGGHEIEAKVMREGDFEGVDLTLLEVDERQLPAHIGLRLMPLCASPPHPGQPVVVVIPGSFARSRILSPQALPKDVRDRFDTIIADVASTGNSGSGVFDATSQCLLGIMSRKIQRVSIVKTNGTPTRRVDDLAKYFVPAVKIREFMQRP
jgi:hypothetical protein